MAKVTNTGAGALKLVKPDAIVVTLFTGAETDDIPKGDSYVLDDVIRDTTSIAQDDNSTSDIERETSDTPILSVVTSGKYQLAAEVAKYGIDASGSRVCTKCGEIWLGDVYEVIPCTDAARKTIEEADDADVG